jgi:ABC-2 type transport system ATP-binding protein
LGEKHTILLSTHIMPEVEAVCGRVLIIAKGRLVVDDKLDRLRTEAAVLAEVRGPSKAVKLALEALNGVRRASIMSDDSGVVRLEIHCESGGDLREMIAQRVIQNGWGLRSLDLRRSSLEERFVRAVNESDPASRPGESSTEAA